MDALYKKVTKGVFQRLGPEYSEELNHVVKKLLNVSPVGRPSCEQILTSEVVQKKLI
jgi:hypothetical protein